MMSIFTSPAFLTGGFLAAFALQMLFEITAMMTSSMSMLESESSGIPANYSRAMLQSHPECGMTTKGREECWWKCMTGMTSDGQYFFKVSKIHPDTNVIQIIYYFVHACVRVGII